jgi:hypothetical protein
VHNDLVRHIAVGKDDLIGVVFMDQVDQLTFGEDGDSGRIEFASQLGGVRSALNVGDLGCREGDYIVGWIVAEAHIEIVEIPSSGTHDNHSGLRH